MKLRKITISPPIEQVYPQEIKIQCCCQVSPPIGFNRSKAIQKFTEISLLSSLLFSLRSHNIKIPKLKIPKLNIRTQSQSLNLLQSCSQPTINHRSPVLQNSPRSPLICIIFPSLTAFFSPATVRIIVHTTTTVNGISPVFTR